ncbi:MAG: dihydrofolate synthase, partial [Mesorhizobium sp.]|nr:dihydrofolate synthase [Mesorhizobium sp.]
VILGPLLDDDPGTSGTIVQRMLDGGTPMLPRIWVDVVDVRDVAALHVAAMTAQAAGGHRFIAADRPMSFREMTDILRAAFPDRAGKIPRYQAPDWLMRFAALFNGTARDSLAELGPVKRTDTGPARALLGRPFVPAEDAAIAMARGLIDNRLV